MANRLVQPMKKLAGVYGRKSWPGYKFKELLGYTSGVHTGVDYNGVGGGNADLGFGAYAIGTGKVVKKVTNSKSPRGFGNVLIYELTDKALVARIIKGEKLKGATKIYVRFMHLDKFLVNLNSTVQIGQRIANVGNTGTKWAHLHADMWHNGFGLDAHMQYHKDTKLVSYLDVYKTVVKYSAEPKPPLPNPIDLLKKQIADLKALLTIERNKPPKVVKVNVPVVKTVREPLTWERVVNWIVDKLIRRKK